MVFVLTWCTIGTNSVFLTFLSLSFYLLYFIYLLDRDIHTGLCVCRMIQLGNEVLLVWKWHLGTVRFDPDQACQRVWAEFWCFPKCMDIGDVEYMFYFIFLDGVCFCGCLGCVDGFHVRDIPERETRLGYIIS